MIPEGFAHGFLVLSDEAEFCYKVNDFWHPNDEGGLAWNDPAIGIEWPQVKGTYDGTPSAAGYMMEDEIFDKLLIWAKDENGNDTLYHLKEAGVGAICLSHVPTEFSLSSLKDRQTNGVIRSTGMFL